MKITEKFLTPNKFSRPQIPLEKVTKIAVHYTGDPGATAQNTHDYFENLKNQIPDSTGKFTNATKNALAEWITLFKMSF